MFIRNKIAVQSVETKGIVYPRQWLDSATSEQLAAIGVSKTPDPVIPDLRFHDFVQRADGTYASTPKSVTDMPDPVSGVVFPGIRSQLKGIVNAEAGRRILAIAPEWKQANMTARMVELMPKMIGNTTSADEKAEISAAHAIWDRIKAIRAYSNTITQAIDGLDHAGCSAWTMPATAWPE